MKAILFCLIFIFAANTARSATELIAPETGIAGETILIKITTDADLPASSFFRADIECPVKPEGAKIDILAGWPESEMKVSKPGIYECSAEIGVVTKGSCAGATYKSLTNEKFRIEVGK